VHQRRRRHRRPHLTPPELAQSGRTSSAGRRRLHGGAPRGDARVPRRLLEDTRSSWATWCGPSAATARTPCLVHDPYRMRASSIATTARRIVTTRRGVPLRARSPPLPRAHHLRRARAPQGARALVLGRRDEPDVIVDVTAGSSARSRRSSATRARCQGFNAGGREERAGEERGPSWPRATASYGGVFRRPVARRQLPSGKAQPAGAATSRWRRRLRCESEGGMRGVLSVRRAPPRAPTKQMASSAAGAQVLERRRSTIARAASQSERNMRRFTTGWARSRTSRTGAGGLRTRCR
jgi:hypothetical protein